MKAVTQPAVAVVEADAEEGGHHRVAHGGVDEEDDEEGEILPPLAHLRDGVCAELPPRAPLRPRGDEHEQRDDDRGPDGGDEQLLVEVVRDKAGEGGDGEEVELEHA